MKGQTLLGVVACMVLSACDDRNCSIVGKPVDASFSDFDASHGDQQVPQPTDADATDTTGIQPLTLIARWALIGSEDPLTVDFIKDEDALFGVICWSSMNCEEAASVTGTRSELNVSFGYTQPWAPKLFRFTGSLSADGSRMGGTFEMSSTSQTVAWLRLPPGKELLDLDPSKFLVPMSGSMWVDLKLLQRPTDSSEFDNGKTYRFLLTHYGVFGDLGAFWHTERTQGAPLKIQHPDGRLLDAIGLGPVAATRNDLSTKIVVGTLDDEVQAVWLTLPSGAEFLFGP